MDEEILKIPYAVHEGDMARMERSNKRLWILCILLFLALVLTNAGWIYYEAQFVEIETMQEVEQDVDTGDGNAFVHGIGDVYGESASARQGNDKETSP